MLADVPPPVGGPPGPAVQIVHHINAARFSNGLRRVHITRKLTRLAEQQNQRMLRNGVFSHDTGNGMSFAYRVRKLPFARLGETLAWAPVRANGAPWDVARGWMRSPAHRKLLLDPSFRRVGVSQMAGYIDGVPGVVTTAEFSTRR